MMSSLIVLIDGRRAGTLEADKRGRARFRYDEAWRGAPDALPLSLSLPLAATEHDAEIVDAVLWGLLPDNDRVLQQWAALFQVSPRNAMGLLAHMGEDCAGAVQFVPPERVDALQGGAADGVEWLDSAQIAQRLRELRSGAPGRHPEDAGQFSLAGAQAKTALLHEGGRWGIPRGRRPTTHILKPPGASFDGFAQNEHFCLALARRMGLPAARSEVRHFDEEVAISVERYDRLRTERGWRRIHQEDFCQALGVHPARKYQNQGGPGPKAIADLLRTYSNRPVDDVRTFFQALVLNWLLAGTDAHAKNCSLLIGGGGRVRLAPLYDIASAFPYPALPVRKIAAAMKIGSHYRWWEIRHSDWLHLLDELRLARDQGVADLQSIAQRLPGEAEALRDALRGDGLEHPVLDRLVQDIAHYSDRSRRIAGGILDATPPESDA